MEKFKKRILVIGGGFSGLGSIKSLKEEGYDPICYEKTSHPGGTWYYREETPYGLPSIMPTTVINHSKEMGALTNFPPDKRYPNYMRHHELYQLFTDVGEHFDCFKHIIYNREVIKVKRSADYDETGRWDVAVKNTETGEMTEEVFDVVWLAVGHITYPYIAQYPGIENFKGSVMHTHSLKRADKFKDKKVLVIGIGCSGVDAAVEASNVASQVYLSSRNGGWILPRVGPYGLPFDYCMLRRYSNVMQSVMGYKFASWWLETFQINKKFNHSLYKLKPPHPALGKDPVTNDLLPAKVISGSIEIKRNVKIIKEKGVIFENEDHVTEVDVIIIATGYTWQFPFLEENVVRKEEGRINLYKCVFPSQLKHPTLAIIGFLLPLGPGFPLGEMQCRWAAQVLSGHCKLPSEEDMLKEIKTRHKQNAERFSPSEKMSVRVDYIPYMDDIANEIGCKPNLWKLFFTDFKLYKALAFGPSLPYQYRLEGPHKWDGAREAILTAYDRVRYPLSGEKDRKTKQALSFGHYLKYFIIFFVMAFWLTQSETCAKYYLLALTLPYFMTWKGFYKKYFFSLLMLPFFVSWEGFVSCYMITIFVPIFLAIITSI
ncbi:flavin-containing monooxygenase 5-like [Argiope bruennichi]|uniref:flavin-containing monooxygenase 5-like n=1 Tax=Argiope bruennichi TaxID=94029 RepID=UPI002494830C|nr:flavin-containing monooxygenase 5-like [Argiope bruennichi]XP_055929744.1 flavin-containing monooxygenase 5-like [Argiope bruennichi]